MEEKVYTEQSIIIENRKKLNISGVKDVLSFDDETLLLDTALGRLTVKGEGLQITARLRQRAGCTPQYICPTVKVRAALCRAFSDNYVGN